MNERYNERNKVRTEEYKKEEQKNKKFTSTPFTDTAFGKTVAKQIAFLCVLILLLFSSCDRRELTYYEVSEISIYVDWSLSGLDANESKYGATAMFYPQDGSEPKLFLMGDRASATVRLPEGIYNVILFNRSYGDFGNIAFRGIEHYETLEAYARKVETRMDESTRTETRTIIGSPEALAVATLEGFTVTEDMLGNYGQTTNGRSAHSTEEEVPEASFILRLTPKKLTREVVATLHISGLNNIRSAKCRLDGVSESVFLASGNYSGTTVTQEFVPATPEFTPGSPFDGTLTGIFEVFGSGLTDTHNLHLEANLVDGTTTFTGDYDNVEVSEKEDGNGAITIHVEVITDKIPDVKPDGGSGSGFDVDVDGWGDDVNTDIPLQ